MADPARGHRFLIQLGRESIAGYGFAATPTGPRLWCYNFKAKPNLGVDVEEALGPSIAPREVYQLGRLWDFEFETDLNYIGMLKWLHMVMGEDASPVNPTVTGPVDSIYTHIYKVGKVLPSYTAEVIEGAPNATLGSRFNGMMVEKFVLSGRAGLSNEARLKMKVSGLCRERFSNLAPTALTMANPRAVLFHHASIVDDGSADPPEDVLIRGWSLELSSPIDRERFVFGDSPLLQQPVRDKHFRAEMTFSQEWQTETQYANFMANADLSPEMEFTGPETVGAGSVRSIKFSMAKSRIIDLDPPVSEFGILKKEIKHLGLHNATNAGPITITVKTDQATIALG